MARNASLDPDKEHDSLIQPGRRVSDFQLEPELPGTLRITGNPFGEPLHGAFAEVFKGEWTSPEGVTTIVAIKHVQLPGKNIPPDRFRTRIKRETVIWKAASHPNILPFIGYQIVNDRPMLVSPWCEKGNLSAFIKNTPGITRDDKLKLLCDAARGLVHLHSLDPKIVHGDIKPENVIVQDNIVAALCDFGISKVHVGLEEHTGLTTSGRTGGTSGYQAPELLSDEAATPSTDVYAFGGLILAAMSGNQPFWKMRQASTIIAVFSGKTPNPADHPALPKGDPIWGLLLECWKGNERWRVPGEPEEEDGPPPRPPMSYVLQALESQISPENR